MRPALIGVQLLSPLVLFLIAACQASLTSAAQPALKLLNDMALSPDGAHLAFCWSGEIWIVSVDGGQAARLTNHPADDSQPKFSPDGAWLAFVSDRSGSDQIYSMPVAGGAPQQKTFHSEGYALQEWFPDGQSVLAIVNRDHFYRGSQRMVRIDMTQRAAEQLLLDDTATYASISHDGNQILFVREGERWWRKGYRGERAAQIWQLNLTTGETQELLHTQYDCLWPMWMANDRGFYFTQGDDECFDLWRYRFARNDKPAKQNKIVDCKQDSAVKPVISRDGTRLVYRQLFDLYSVATDQAKPVPKLIEITVAADTGLPDDSLHSTLSEADQVAFTDDGLELAFTAGGDLWLMDTELREPVMVQQTAGTEANPLFAPDGRSLWFTRAMEGQVDIWKLEPKNPAAFWWQQKEFIETQITSSGETEGDLQFTPDGKSLLFQSGRGDLVQLDIASGVTTPLFDGFSRLEYSISSDSQWLALAAEDHDFNSEIWLLPLDLSQPATNVSRHPDNDQNPVFSPDGKILAFTGRRNADESDVYYVYLQEELDEETSRDRRLEKALEAMKKRSGGPANADTKSEKKPDKKPEANSLTEGATGPNANSPTQNASEPGPDVSPAKQTSNKEDADAGVPILKIDLLEIHERVRRISIPNTTESNLIFSPDGKKLAFAASIDGKSGWHSVEFPDKLEPKLMSSTPLRSARWTKAAEGILGLHNGIPAKLEKGEKLVSYAFSARHQRSRAGRLREGFNAAWRQMFEIWYDPAMGGKNWDAIRRKYVGAAAGVADEEGLGEIVELMLGELNGSHLGFTPTRIENNRPPQQTSSEFNTTAHLGLRFDMQHAGPGLKIRDVLPRGPADMESSQLLAGDIVLSIDGTAVDPLMDLTAILNGPLERDVWLTIQRQRAGQSTELKLSVRPISYVRARSLLYDQWLMHNRQKVEELSAGKLGYLHIRAMDQGSFLEFERQLYNVGYQREGLIIDVRDNGGGSTTDHLLTALTQPRHAITVPRGGSEGYPHDRQVYATWSKPIVVLCNQNSYSNAEIFSHAIKALGRGKLVGVQTAGGVVSTGSARVTDVGLLRAPFRGWFSIVDGRDMELNGALPDLVLWPLPGELPYGIDRQLEKGVEILREEVGKAAASPKPQYASELRKAQPQRAK
jgi:tricorn protease